MVVVLGVATVTGCKKSQEDFNINEKKTDKDLYNTLLKTGVKKQNIVEVDEYYVVEGDILFKKNKTDLKKVIEYFNFLENANNELISLNKIQSTRDIPQKIAQWQSPGSVSNWNVERIYIQNTTYLSYQIIHAAFGNWANVENCKINFYGFAAKEVPNENSIKVVANNNISAYASAGFPNSDQPYYQIFVNMNLFNTLSDAQKIYILTHEIGHCLGLRHSDLLTNGEGSGNATQIPGTPANDYYSIMNSGSYHSYVPSFSSMAYYDKVAVQYLYPLNLYDNWITYPSGKYPNIELFTYDFNQNIEIKWNKDLVQTSGVKLELYQNNQMIHVIGNNIPNTGSYSYPFNKYATPTSNYIFDTYLKITSVDNPNIFDFSPLFRSWYD